MIIQAFKKTIKFGEGYYPIKKDAEESGKFIYGIWSLIWIAFNEGYVFN